MPKQIIPLNVRKIETTRPSEKDQSLFDGGGLFLLIKAQRYTVEGKLLPSLKGWRFKYRFDGKPCQISFGGYPEISLEEARNRRREARQQVVMGVNPSAERKRAKSEAAIMVVVSGDTFKHIAEHWIGIQSSEWTEGHARTVQSRLERDVYPLLGGRLISSITTADVITVLRIVEARQAYETASRIRTIISQIFRHARVSSVPGVTINPADGLGKILVQHQAKGMSAIIDPDTLGRLLRDIDNYTGTFIVCCALRLAPLLFVRPGELRHAKWANIDINAGVWRLPIEDTKLTMVEKAAQKGQVQTIPLSKQAVAVLIQLKPFTGRGQYVFPGRTALRPMSGNTVNMALRTMGWDKDIVTGHGFRATARTMLHEILGFSPDAIEAQLGHRVPDRLGAAYNRTKHIKERMKMMQEWADYLDKIRV
jgi:integrase